MEMGVAVLEVQFWSRGFSRKSSSGTMLFS